MNSSNKDQISTQTWLWLLILIVTPVCISLQGIDMTDTGWLLSNYQQFFNDPESTSYWFHIWIPRLLGGIWYISFKDAGVLGFKLAGVLIFWITAFFVYLLFKRYVQNRYLLPALVAGMVLHFAGKITIIHYNNLTTLFLAAGVWVLVKGIEKGLKSWLFFAGVIFAVNVFVRVPNLLGVLFSGVILYKGWKERVECKALLYQLLSFFSGFLLGIGVIILLIHGLGQWTLFYSSLTELFRGSNEDLSQYRFNQMEKKFLYDHGRALLSAGVLYLLIYGVTRILQKIKRYSLSVFSFVLVFFLAYFLNIFVFRNEMMVVVYPLVGISYLTCLWVLSLPEERKSPLKDISWAVILCLGILSVGSDTGMKVASYGLIFSFPLLFYVWMQLPDITLQFNFVINGNGIGKNMIPFPSAVRKQMFFYLLVAYSAFSILFLWSDTYRDSPDRLRMNTKIQHPLAGGIYTTEERAKVLHEVLQELSTRIKPGDLLLTYENIPMIHFLTGTRPYNYNSWSNLYLPLEYEKALKKAEAERKLLPIVVLGKSNTRSSFWPKSPFAPGKENERRNRSILYDFLNRYRYVVVWENEAFIILRPSEGGY